MDNVPTTGGVDSGDTNVDSTGSGDTPLGDTVVDNTDIGNPVDDDIVITNDIAASVRFAWSAADPDAECLLIGSSLFSNEIVDDTLIVDFKELMDVTSIRNDIIIIKKKISLRGGVNHILRITGVSKEARGAYASITVSNDKSRELLPAETSTLAWMNSGRDAMQINFNVSVNGDFCIKILFRGNVNVNDTAIVLKRIILVEAPVDDAEVNGDSCNNDIHINDHNHKDDCKDTIYPGRSIFRDLHKLKLSRHMRTSLASASVLTNEHEALYSGSKIPAGYAFVLNNVLRDVTSKYRGRIPALDLRSMYGSSTTRMHLLDRHMRFKINITQTDLVRDGYGKAMVLDSRIDKHYIDAQLHLLLLRYHNRIMDHFVNVNAQQGLQAIPLPELFNRTRICVIKHWQWIVLFDVVKSLVPDNIFKDVIKYGQRYYPIYTQSTAPKIPPLEFTHAVAQIHWSLRRDTYKLQSSVHLTEHHSKYYVGGVLPPTPLDIISLFNADCTPSGALDSYIPRSCAISKLPTESGFHTQHMEASTNNDTISPFQAILDKSNNNLSSGYVIAKHMGILPLSDESLIRTDRTGVFRALAISTRKLPLLIYILKEAEIRGEGSKLHGVGARLLTEFIRGLIWSNPKGLCCLSNSWKPSMPRSRMYHYTMSDLVNWTLRPMNITEENNPSSCYLHNSL